MQLMGDSSRTSSLNVMTRTQHALSRGHSTPECPTGRGLLETSHSFLSDTAAVELIGGTAPAAVSTRTSRSVMHSSQALKRRFIFLMATVSPVARLTAFQTVP